MNKPTSPEVKEPSDDFWPKIWTENFRILVRINKKSRSSAADVVLGQIGDDLGRGPSGVNSALPSAIALLLQNMISQKISMKTVQN